MLNILGQNVTCLFSSPAFTFFMTLSSHFPFALFFLFLWSMYKSEHMWSPKFAPEVLHTWLTLPRVWFPLHYWYIQGTVALIPFLVGVVCTCWVVASQLALTIFSMCPLAFFLCSQMRWWSRKDHKLQTLDLSTIFTSIKCDVWVVPKKLHERIIVTLYLRVRVEQWVLLKS